MCENNNYNNENYLINYIDITGITDEQKIITLIKKVRESNDPYYGPLKTHITTYSKINDVGYFQIKLKKYTEDFFKHCIEYDVKPTRLKANDKTIDCRNKEVTSEELFTSPVKISNLRNLLNESNI